jgi:hypothetical protein
MQYLSLIPLKELIVQLFYWALILFFSLVGFIIGSLLFILFMWLIALLLEKVFKLSIDKRFQHWLIFAFVLWCCLYVILCLIKLIFSC